jgi:sugar lactone lactonase YvrE
MRKIPNIIVLITVLLLITSCNNQQQSEEDNWTCIEPPETLAYPVLQGQDTLPEVQMIPPPEPWEIVTLNPDELADMVIPEYGVRLATDNNGLLWMLTHNGILTFNTLTEEIETYPYVQNESGRFSSLITSNDGSIWLANPSGYFGENETRFLAQYDQNENRFIIISDNQHILEGIGDRIQLIAADSQGNLWITIHGREEHGFYRFNPTTNNTTFFPLPDEYSSITSMVISPMDMVWFYDHLQNEIVVFDTISGRIVETIDMAILLLSTNPAQMDSYLGSSSNLYFDDLGRLWISDFGWFEIDPIPGEVYWFSIIRSPVFIVHNTYDDISYFWLRPRTLLQSSDGMYWFSSGAGSVRLDPNTSQWCLFTTAESPIVEDVNHTLWMVAYGGLYRYSLEP